jgi:DNA-binding LytR/AlgR family response regulator
MNLAFVRIRQELERAAALRTMVITAAGGLFLAVLGPLGTDAAPLLTRLIYWLSLAEIGAVFGILTNITLRRLLDPEDRRVLLVAVVTGAAITLPITAVVFEVTKLFFQANEVRGGVRASEDLPGFLAPVLAISLAFSLVNALAHRRPVHTHAAKPDAQPVRFNARLPPRLRGAEIYAVHAEDHYLRIHTSRGNDLILMRLSDAIAELDGLEGAQTHRSWWVARRAVRAARRLHARATLELPGDIEAPVSRNFARALKAEGWFE